MDVVKMVAKLAKCDVATATLAVAHHDNIITDIADKRRRFNYALERYVRRKTDAERVTPQYGNKLGVRVQTSGGHDKLFVVAVAREEVDKAKDAWRDAYKGLLQVVRQCELDADVHVAYVMRNVVGYGWSQIAKTYDNLFDNDDDVRYRCCKGTAIVVAKMIEKGELENVKAS